MQGSSPMRFRFRQRHGRDRPAISSRHPQGAAGAARQPFRFLIMHESTTSFYRQIAAEGASYIGLLTVVLDSLAEDLRRAGVAASRHDITSRCIASNHAFLLLGHLESWAAEMEEPALKASLLSFYFYLRATLLKLQIETSEHGFRDLAMHVTQLRITWQKKEMEVLQSYSSQKNVSHYPKPAEQASTRLPTTWSA